MTIDIAVFKIINSLAGKYKFLDWLGIFLAEYLPYILVIAVLAITFYERNWRKRLYDFLFVAAVIILSRGFITTVIRFFYHRERPFIALPDSTVKLIEKSPEASFPSGHAMLFFALAMAVYYIRPKYFPYFLIGAVFVGAARIFVGVHYPFDIIAGAGLGIISSYLVHRFFPKLPSPKDGGII
jgi:undecaprenyl-diphosphatase